MSIVEKKQPPSPLWSLHSKAFFSILAKAVSFGCFSARSIGLSFIGNLDIPADAVYYPLERMFCLQIQPELITLDTSEIAQVNTSLMEQENERLKNVLYVRPRDVKFTPKHKKKGRSGALKKVFVITFMEHLFYGLQWLHNLHKNPSFLLGLIHYLCVICLWEWYTRIVDYKCIWGGWACLTEINLFRFALLTTWCSHLRCFLWEWLAFLIVVLKICQ